MKFLRTLTESPLDVKNLLTENIYHDSFLFCIPPYLYVYVLHLESFLLLCCSILKLIFFCLICRCCYFCCYSYLLLFKFALLNLSEKKFYASFCLFCCNIALVVYIVVLFHNVSRLYVPHIYQKFCKLNRSIGFT